MTIASECITPEDAASHSWQAVSPSRTWTDSIELVKQLAQVGAVAIKLPECFHQTAIIERPFGLVLVPVDEAVKRLVSARKSARSLGVEISIFACTEARRAVAINRDLDSHDRKYLSGLTLFEGLHAYCGGLDATISRGLICASHADVVCFKSATPDLFEARRFAAAIRAASPEKQLAFGYAPRSDGSRWNEIDHAAFESELHSLGFNYYFFTQFDSMVFPHFPSVDRWVMFDDALKMQLPAMEI